MSDPTADYTLSSPGYTSTVSGFLRFGAAAVNFLAQAGRHRDPGIGITCFGGLTRTGMAWGSTIIFVRDIYTIALFHIGFRTHRVGGKAGLADANDAQKHDAGEGGLDQQIGIVHDRISMGKGLEVLQITQASLYYATMSSSQASSPHFVAISAFFVPAFRRFDASSVTFIAFLKFQHRKSPSPNFHA
ncbi:MAG: hypothetical protein ACRESO_02925 [Gammaproteobacteria bacterium]